MTDTDRTNAARLAREHSQAVEVIALAIHEWPWTSAYEDGSRKLARAILARLAAHDPPLLIGTGRESELRDSLRSLIEHHLSDAAWDAAVERAEELLR